MLKYTKDLNKRRAHFKFFFWNVVSFWYMTPWVTVALVLVKGLCVFQSQCTRFKNNGKMKDFDKRRIHFFFFFSKHIFFFTFTTCPSLAYWIWNASKNERLKPHLIFFSERCFLLVDFYLVRRTHFVTRVQSMVWVFFEAVRFKNKAQSEVWQIERLNKATNPFFFFSKLLLLCMMVVWHVAVDMIYNHIPASTQINDSYCLMPHVHSWNSQFEIYKNRKT